MRKILIATALVATLAAPTVAAAQHYHHHHHHHQHRGVNPWPWIGGAIIGGVIIDALRPPPPVIHVHPAPPPWFLHQPPVTCGAIYLGDDAWGRPRFGNFCR